MGDEILRKVRSDVRHEDKFSRVRNVTDEDKDPVTAQVLPVDGSDPLPMWKIMLLRDRQADEEFMKGYDRIVAANLKAGRKIRCPVCTCLMSASGKCCE
jgi:hypothetical protein